MTARWVDPDADDEHRPPFFIEFGISIINKKLPGQSIGCGFRSMRQLLRWFSASEVERMLDLGYNIVEINADQILAESNNQLVFVCNKPLRQAARGIGVAFAPTARMT
jgi:hypothetical protein